METVGGNIYINIYILYGPSPLQELEVDPCSWLYLLVSKNSSKSKMFSSMVPGKKMHISFTIKGIV